MKISEMLLNFNKNKLVISGIYAGFFILLIAFTVITPSLFFNQPKSNVINNIVGHTASHSEIQSDCGIVSSNPIKKVTLVTQQILWEVAPGQSFQAWTFNGSIPGPAICLNHGDTLILKLVNKLPTIISFHAHGLKHEYSSDGTYMSTSFAVPGGSYTYTLTADNISVGTWAYHDAVAEMDEDIFFQNRTSPESGEGIERGLFGAIIVYGDSNSEPDNIDHEIILVEAEFEAEVTLGPTYMTFNGKIYPDTPHFIFKQGEVIRFRIINVGPNANHNILVKGFNWKDTKQLSVVEGAYFGALEFGDYIIEASQIAQTQYICNVENHHAEGMHGNFTIIP